MPFLDVPSSPAEASASSSSGLSHLKLRQNERDPPRVGAKLQEIDLTPMPGFVIKTTLQTLHAASSAPPLTKLFINVSSAEQVPPPLEEKANPLCAVGAVESTTDKAGHRSLVIDATLNTSVLLKAKKDKSYKQWLIQWVLEKVEEKMGVELSRNYSEPNIKSKGALIPRKAVLPIPVVQKAATSDKIQVVEASSGPLDVSKAPTLAGTDSSSDQSKRKPKTGFEVVDEGTAFVFRIEIPEEPISNTSGTNNFPAFTIKLTSTSLKFSSSSYELETVLPLRIQVDDVQTRSAEWSQEEKAIRVWGKLQRRST